MRLPFLALTTLASSCALGVDDSVICTRTDQPTTEHAAALAVDGGDRSVVTGAKLIGILDAGCER